MNLFGAMEVSASAMRAERLRAEVVTSNLANAEATRTDAGGPYKRKLVVFGTTPFRDHLAVSRATAGTAGVEVRAVLASETAPELRYEPSHPDADAQGYVAYPAINPVEEMADLMGAMRAYQMNAAAVNASKQMIEQTLEILR